MARVRVLLFDDGEVPCAQLWLWLRAAGAELVVARAYYELPGVLTGQAFDVLLGNEVLLLVAAELGVTARRCLLTAWPGDWSPAQLAHLGVAVVISELTPHAELLVAVGLERP